jgi:4-alpha-glucanotransferase
MNVIFNETSVFLRYRSGYGQSLWLSGNIKSMGSSEPEKALAMTYLNEEFWIISLDIKKNDFKKNICYKYFVKNEDGSIFHDWENNRCIDASFDSFKEIFLTDTWNAAGAFENTFYTVPFTETLLRENFTKGKAKQVKNPTHVFKVKAPLLEKDEVMCLLGSGKKLGAGMKQNPYFWKGKTTGGQLRLIFPVPVFLAHINMEFIICEKRNLNITKVEITVYLLVTQRQETYHCA